MDFFQHQETARRRTGLLVFYFVAAVVLIILLTYAIVAGALLVARPARGPQAQHAADPVRALWDPALFAIVAVGTLALVGGGSLYRVASLAGGGHTVAEMMGGRPLLPQTTDPDERKILNVVEEMAIASGTPVPPVYLLEHEDGINAFAAGYTPGDAVIGVTRGCIRNLSRDELQGVIAHEFSHILNGDMRLNIRLIGVLYGILLISMTGWIIFRSTAGFGGSSRDDGEKRGGNPWPLVGLALYVLGYVGVFFGNLIKAAVSRQREFLADASAVQFTRNPDGIAGALKKIGAAADGSRVAAPEAREASHLFFGDAVGHLLGAFATHPPLEERIRRIDPSFDGTFTIARGAAAGPPRPAAAAAALAPGAGAGGGAFRISPADVVSRIGTIEPRQIAYASAVLTALPGSLKALAHEPFTARAVVLALLVDRDSEAVQAVQLQQLGTHAEPALLREVEKALPMVQSLAPELRLPLASMAVPALRRLSPDQSRAFAADVRAMIRADNRVSLFEYALERLLFRHLAARPDGTAAAAANSSRSADRLVGPVRHVLGVLAHVGGSGPSAAAGAFAAGVRALGWPGVDPSLPPREPDLRKLDAALDQLDAATPPLKRRILAACAACIGADGQVTLEEGELLRAIADSLGCPVPPLRSLAAADPTATFSRPGT